MGSIIFRTAVTVVAGLLTSTILTLIIIPVVYSLAAPLDRRHDKDQDEDDEGLEDSYDTELESQLSPELP